MMLQTLDQMLYIDPQDTVPVGFCPLCGGELWTPEASCSRCEKEDSHDPA